MDKTIRVICGLLKSPDNMRRCAAAMVLSELGPRDAAVVQALGEVLPGAGEPLLGYLLDALEKTGSKAAVPYVMPMLDAEDPAIRLKAVAIAAAAGPALVPAVRKMMANAPRRRKMALADLLARIRSADALDLLLTQLTDPDFDVVRETCNAVQRHAKDATPRERSSMRKQVLKFMKSADVRGRERVLVSCLLLLGHIGCPETYTILLDYAKPAASPYLRRHALIALKGLIHTGRSASAVLRKVFPYLEEDDADLVRLVLDVLERLPSDLLGAEHAKKLLKSKHGYVRTFAARRLSGSDTDAANRQLMELLDHESADVRETAGGILAQHPKAARLLMDSLKKEKDVEAAWRLARILKPHHAAVDAKCVKVFAKLAAAEMAKGSAKYEPLLYVVRNADPKAADTVLLDVGLAQYKAKHWPQAVDCLRRLIHTPLFNPEISYALTISDLKVSRKDLSPQARAECHAIKGFRALRQGRSADLLQQLQKDKNVDAADLYYVGFHFREQGGEDVGFGEDLLRHVVKKWPKSPEAKAIRKMPGILAARQ